VLRRAVCLHSGRRVVPLLGTLTGVVACVLAPVRAEVPVVTLYNFLVQCDEAVRPWNCMRAWDVPSREAVALSVAIRDAARELRYVLPMRASVGVWPHVPARRRCKRAAVGAGVQGVASTLE
jgi:hypothetical protein